VILDLVKLSPIFFIKTLSVSQALSSLERDLKLLNAVEIGGAYSPINEIFCLFLPAGINISLAVCIMLYAVVTIHHRSILQMTA